MPADARPTCGDGLIMRPEQCDLGTDGSNQSRNAYDASCSIGCTTWNPLSCTIDGTCPVPESPPPSGQDVSRPPFKPARIRSSIGSRRRTQMPGKREVGSTNLPAWITIADVDFDSLIRRERGVASSVGTATQEETCASAGTSATITTCPGDLRTFWNSKLRKFVCAPPLTAAPRVGGRSHSFFINGPYDSEYAAVRGRIVTVAKGQLDGFLNASFPWDFSGQGCYGERDGGGSCVEVAAGSLYHSNQLRSLPGADIDSRYVDGVSITVGCSASERGRRHVFTLAAGTATGIISSAVVSSFPGDAGANTTRGDDTYSSCWDDLTRAATGCYLGNCLCQGGDALRTQLGGASAGFEHRVPGFVGEGTRTPTVSLMSCTCANLHRVCTPRPVSDPPPRAADYYCDGGAGETDGYDYSNQWKGHPMFNSSDVCVGGSGVRDTSWWAARGGPGYFLKYLDEVTSDPLEVHIAFAHTVQHLLWSLRLAHSTLAHAGASHDRCRHVL